MDRGAYEQEHDKFEAGRSSQDSAVACWIISDHETHQERWRRR
jgi:hypothetical protein